MAALKIQRFTETTDRFRNIILFFFFFFMSIDFVHSQTPCSTCSPGIHLSSSKDGRNCTNTSWCSFSNGSRCGQAFDDYLFELGLRANLTGKIFLDLQDCRIDQLTSRAGGCSNYTVQDVLNNLGNGFKQLQESCQYVGLGRESGRPYCEECSTMWDEIGRSASNVTVLDSAEANLCKVVILVTLTSTRIGDLNWVRAIYKCLGIGKQISSSILDETEDRKANRGTLSRAGIWILICGLIGILIVVAVVFWTFCGREVEKLDTDIPKGKDASNGPVSRNSSSIAISVKEVYSATNNFSPSNFIGQGLAGKVYKGILSNGQHIAVKHIISDGQVDTFVREVTSLSDVQHPNLVALLGYCENEDEFFLIYELCHNGNLSEWLSGKDKVLSWIQRLEIAIDCARGLWFLHTYPDGCIVHRDIKPTNILLSENFQAKLSDFGLSKVIDSGQSFVSLEVRGTFGYVDPEYRRNHHVNASGDVYSFGVVLLQLISGQRVINLNLNYPTRLDRRAKVLRKDGNIAEFADPKLNTEYSAEVFESVFKLALSCTGLTQQRPSMEQVVVRLEKALSQSIISDDTSKRSIILEEEHQNRRDIYSNVIKI